MVSAERRASFIVNDASIIGSQKFHACKELIGLEGAKLPNDAVDIRTFGMQYAAGFIPFVKKIPPPLSTALSYWLHVKSSMSATTHFFV